MNHKYKEVPVMPLLVAHSQYMNNYAGQIITVSNIHNRNDPPQQFRPFARQRWLGSPSAELSNCFHLVSYQPLERRRKGFD
jgi:hypothetical protein